MYFKYLFKQLYKRISDLSEIHDLVGIENESVEQDPYLFQVVLQKLSDVQTELEAAYIEIDNHHVNYSLFLESLFRRDHFEKGRFVLRNQIINVDKEIIKPQLRHYKRRLLARNITIAEPVDLISEDYSIKADLGLLAQVYANLFSNAVKYTGSIIDRNGQKRKAMAYGRKILSDFYGTGRSAIKFNVFTTGPHLSREEIKNIFLDGYQGENSCYLEGKGHGLAFVKYIIELHGGTVGCDTTEQGNNFYFILPLA